LVEKGIPGPTLGQPDSPANERLHPGIFQPLAVFTLHIVFSDDNFRLQVVGNL
jgi:hypothetical protein